MSHARVLAMCLLLVLSGRALAEPVSFVTLERMDDQGRVGLQVGLHDHRGGVFDRLTQLRFELYGQDVLARPFGFYAQLPVVHTLIDGAANRTSLQNLEAGAFALLGDLNVLRLGVSLPTGADDDGTIYNVTTRYERLGDLSAAIPDSLWLRGSFSRVQQLGPIVLRLDAGLDGRLVGDINYGSPYEDWLFAHVGAGLAVLAGPHLAVLVESQNLTIPFSDEDLVRNRFFHAVTLGLRTRGRTQVHAALVQPLDDGARSRLWVASFGVQRLLGR